MDFTNLKNTLDSFVGRYTPGFDCIVYKDHEEIFRYHNGYSDEEAKKEMNGNETYFIFSCTKPIVCTAAMTLFEKGGFSLNEPLYLFIPEFKDLYLKNGEKAKNPLLVRHLFEMKGGFNYDLTQPAIQDVIKENPNATTLDIVRALAKAPLNFEPGTNWEYSLCHDILGGLIEIVSGKKLSEYVKEAILDPVGMTRTSFGLSDKNKDDIAKLYKNDGKKYVPIESPNEYILTPNYESGGAGLVSCVDDYILFSDAMACGGVAKNGNRIISQRTIDLMRKNSLPEEVRRHFSQNQSRGYGYGLGVRTLVDSAEGGTIAPLGEFGWDGAAASYTSISPEEKLSIFYAEHVRGGYHPIIHPRLRNALYSCI